jgi:hypothetical protein
MTTSNITAPAPSRAMTPISLPTRYQLLAAGGVALLLALITMFLAINAYSTTYNLFRNIVQNSSTTVDASENALQFLASTSQSAADYALLTSDTPLYEQAQNNIFRDFSHFRDEMFTLRNNVQTDDERSAFTIADTFTDNRFWRHVSNLLALRSDDEQARREYLSADNHVRNWINPALQKLENLNYEQMVLAGRRAEGIIASRILFVLVPALLLALLLTVVSLRLRQKVHRYLTPGIDIAMLLSWVLIVAMLGNLIAAPGELKRMIQDAYLSVTGSSRILVDANLANRAESSALLDSGNAQTWYERIDDALLRVELRMCGQAGCMNQSFGFGGQARPNASAVAIAQQISPDDSALIEGSVPLLANVTFPGEVEALERARLAFADYRAINVNLRTLIDSGDISSAVAMNTELEAGSSQEAFNRFAEAIEQERTVNRTVFNRVWETESALLLANQTLYGFAGYGLLILAVMFGVYQRYREL